MLHCKTCLDVGSGSIHNHKGCGSSILVITLGNSLIRPESHGILSSSRKPYIPCGGQVNTFDEKKFNINPHTNFNIYITFIIYSFC